MLPGYVTDIAKLKRFGVVREKPCAPLGAVRVSLRKHDEIDLRDVGCVVGRVLNNLGDQRIAGVYSRQFNQQYSAARVRGYQFRQLGAERSRHLRLRPLSRIIRQHCQGCAVLLCSKPS